MSRDYVCSPREAIKILESDGWVLVRQTNHMIFRHPEKGQISVAHSKNVVHNQISKIVGQRRKGKGK